MKILITGAKGMLGQTLMKQLPPLLNGKLNSPKNTELQENSDTNYEITGCDMEDFDISSIKQTTKHFNKINPDVAVHCAAMTDVDGCESNFEKAMQINAIGSANIASCCFNTNARLIAISTDYVFDGNLNRAYNEWDETVPSTAYGKSKLAGEKAIINHCPDSAILRIAWLYGENGPSFYHTMIKLGNQSGDALKVVSDQIGNPTSTDALVPVIAHFIKNSHTGIFHSTCEGECTWYDFANEIFRLKGLKRETNPCSTDEYPRPAKRPANSRLDKMAFRLAGISKMPDWKDALKSFIKTEKQK